MRKIIVGSRDSRLALSQSNWVIEELKQVAAEHSFEIKLIKTKGDKILDTDLTKLGDKGVFVKEIEDALLCGEIDLAVHSMKDVPTVLPAGLEIGAVTGKEDPRDALVSLQAAAFADLPDGALIGTSSLRRIAQLSRSYPRLTFRPVRGNLETRLRKLTEGEFDALVLAYAGLKRLGWLDLVTEIIPPEICLPAVGQGRLAVEIRDDDKAMKELLRHLDRPEERTAVSAERAFLRRLEGGCQIPAGALCEISDGKLRLQGLVASLDGSTILRDEATGPLDMALDIGEKLAEKLLSYGAAAILKKARLDCNAR